MEIDQQSADLRADCSRCFGLCCVALAFSKTAGFGIDKEAGDPCLHLQDDFRCEIHDRLRPEGFSGCTVYDCFGAGQKLSQVTFGGVSWRDAPETAGSMFGLLPVMRQLHELLWYLTEALTIHEARFLRDELAEARDGIDALTRQPPGELEALDVASYRESVNELLLATSELARAELPPPRAAADGGRGTSIAGADLKYADLIGAELVAADLRCTDLRSAYLIGADLRNADLRRADLIGADLRDANLRGADLSTALFLSQMQVNAAFGDGATLLPPPLSHPSHWAH